jgi:hypothetical protein
MRRLQIRLFGPYFSSFSAHSYSYEPSNELKSVLKLPNFRFGPDSPTASWLGGFSGAKAYIRYVEVLKIRRNAGRTFCDAIKMG